MALTVSAITLGEGLEDSQIVMKGVTDAAAAAAQAIYIGFTPRYIKVVNLTDGIADEYFPDNTAGTSYHTTALGAVTVAAANGFTILTDTSATVAKATGSPQSGGPGVVLGTGILVASKTFQIYFER